MGECCNICGDIGYGDFLLTCTRCKINHEHVYCLKIPLEEPIDNWHCEECESVSELEKELPGVSKLTPSEEVISDCEFHALSCRLPNKRLNKGSFGWEKGVARGKTKYIPIKDALKLSSKDIKYRGRLVVTSHPKSSQGPQPKAGVVISEKAPVRSPRVPLGLSPLQNLASGPLQQSKTRINGKTRNIEGQPQQTKNLTELQGLPGSLRNSQAPKDKHLLKEHLPVNMKPPDAKVKKPMKLQSESAPPLKALPPTISEMQGSASSLQTSQAPKDNFMLKERLLTVEYLFMIVFDI